MPWWIWILLFFAVGFWARAQNKKQQELNQDFDVDVSRGYVGTQSRSALKPTKPMNEEVLTNDDFFDAALHRMLTELKGDIGQIAQHRDAILEYVETGDRAGKRVIASLLPESSWSWPRYDEEVVAAHQQSIVDAIKSVDSEADDVMLQRLKISDLRSLLNGKTKGKSKLEIIDRAFETLSAQDRAALCKLAHQKIIDDLLADQLPYEYRCDIFLHRLQTYYYAIRHKHNYRKAYASRARVMAEFQVANPIDARPECLKLHGTVVEPSSQLLDQIGPCESIRCHCHWMPRVNI